MAVYCFVPCCTSTSKSMPHKLFLTVPRHEPTRSKWLKAVRRDVRKEPLSAKSIFRICEDHFDLKNDIENYRYVQLFKSLGKAIQVRLKPGVLPTKFDCQTERLLTAKTKTLTKRAVPYVRPEVDLTEHSEPQEKNKNTFEDENGHVFENEDKHVRKDGLEGANKHVLEEEASTSSKMPKISLVPVERLIDKKLDESPAIKKPKARVGPKAAYYLGRRRRHRKNLRKNKLRLNKKKNVKTTEKTGGKSVCRRSKRTNKDMPQEADSTPFTSLLVQSSSSTETMVKNAANRSKQDNEDTETASESSQTCCQLMDISVKEEPVEINIKNEEETPSSLVNSDKRIHLPDFVNILEMDTEKECIVCRKILFGSISTCCPECPETPSLCLQPCFRLYHSYP